MKKLFLFYIVSFFLYSCGKDENTNLIKDAFSDGNSNWVQVEMDEPSDITSFSARCKAKIIHYHLGEIKISEYGFCIGEKFANEFRIYDYLRIGEDLDSFTATITGFYPNTEHAIKAYCISESDTFYSKDYSFYTLNGDTLFSSDFSLSSIWQIKNFKNFNPKANWIITTNSPQGNYSKQMGPILSNSLNNYYALFDSDYLGSNGENNQYSCIYASNKISLQSSYNTRVYLSFNQYYKKYYDSTFVALSSDGKTWNLYLINENLSNGDITTNPEFNEYEITHFTLSEPNFYFGFAFKSSRQAGSIAWMIDDVKVFKNHNKNHNKSKKLNFYRQIHFK